MKVLDDKDIVLKGNCNGRVGTRREPWNPHMGPFSDINTEGSYNGQQLLSLCTEHDLSSQTLFFNTNPAKFTPGTNGTTWAQHCR